MTNISNANRRKNNQIYRKTKKTKTIPIREKKRSESLETKLRLMSKMKKTN